MARIAGPRPNRNARRHDLPAPLYGQVPQFAAGERGIIDLLGVDRDGRLAVIEFKAEQDIHLPLQALDYWMRVKWHLDRREFPARGYFPGIALSAAAPRLLLVAPSLEYHPSNETILKYFSPDVPVERLGVGLEWRQEVRVMFRVPLAHGSRCPPSNKGALSSLNPEAVREDADRQVSNLRLVAASAESLGRMETFFAPPHFSPERRAEAVRLLVRGPAPDCDLEVYDSSLLRPSRGFALDLEAPDDCIRRILQEARRSDAAPGPSSLSLPQARRPQDHPRRSQGKRDVQPGHGAPRHRAQLRLASPGPSANSAPTRRS